MSKKNRKKGWAVKCMTCNSQFRTQQKPPPGPSGPYKCSCPSCKSSQWVFVVS